MKKAMVPPKKYPKRDRDKSPDRRDRDRSPKRYDHSHGYDHKSGKSGQKRNYNGHGGGSGSGSSKDKGKKPRSSSSKKKGMSSDLSDTFYSFLDSKAIQMVKAVGLDVDNLANVDNLPLGIRLTRFYSNCCNNWAKCDLVPKQKV